MKINSSCAVLACGSMVQKVLSSKQYGKLTDTYAYNSLDQLVSYAGYDGYQQRFTYDANGMRLSKSEYGNSNRSTLEELLRGDIAGLPEVIQPAEDVPEGYEWATTEYLYDITQEYYQVIGQTTTCGNTTTTTAYSYGLERIAAYSPATTTEYIYDGRGSVAQTVSAPIAGADVSAALPQVQSYSYTAFGEQMGMKVSGFGYNAEDYDAGTGMINLRMRQYEPAMNRFSQKDILHGSIFDSLSLNRYCYVNNSPIVSMDPDGCEDKPIAAYSISQLPEVEELMNLSLVSEKPGLDLVRMKGATETYIVHMMSNEALMTYQKKQDGESVEQFWKGFKEESGLAQNDMESILYGEYATEEDVLLVKRMATIRPALTQEGEDYDSNCGIAANIAATSAGVDDMPDYFSDDFLNNTSFKASRKYFNTNDGEDLSSAGVIARKFEEDPSFVAKIQVSNERELDMLMNSPVAQYITVCGVNFDGKATTKDIDYDDGERTVPTYDHIIIHKRTVVSPETGRLIGTFMGASRYRNDMPYNFIYRTSPNALLTFYINKPLTK